MARRRVYVTTSRIQDSAFSNPGAPIALPTSLWHVKFGRRVTYRSNLSRATTLRSEPGDTYRLPHDEA